MFSNDLQEANVWFYKIWVEFSLGFHGIPLSSIGPMIYAIMVMVSSNKKNIFKIDP